MRDHFLGIWFIPYVFFYSLITNFSKEKADLLDLFAVFKKRDWYDMGFDSMDLWLNIIDNTNYEKDFGAYEQD